MGKSFKLGRKLACRLTPRCQPFNEDSKRAEKDPNFVLEFKKKDQERFWV